MKWRQAIAVFAVLGTVAGAACGGKNGGGGTPTGPSASVTSITISSSGSTLFLGATETFTATATKSDGTTQAVTGGTWGTDAPGVATASGAGVITGVGSGEVTVFVDFSGARGTKRIRVLPNYQGNWLGSYMVSSCSQTGQMALADLCGQVFGANTVLPLTFQFTQSGSTLTGRTALGQILSDSFSAPIEGSGRVVILARATSSGIDVTESWALEMSQADRITGEVEIIFRDSVLTGSVTVHARLINTNRQSSAVLPAGAGAGAGTWTLRDLGKWVR